MEEKQEFTLESLNKYAGLASLLACAVLAYMLLKKKTA